MELNNMKMACVQMNIYFGEPSKNFTTVRQLERSFKQHIGISPKQMINLIRYQNAMTAFQARKPKESILSIAFDYGYYDHAHLANDFKRYNGVTPAFS